MTPGLLELALSALLALPPSALQPPDERIRFTIPFPEDQGGGSATGFADDLEYQEEDFARLTGNVEIRYQDMVFRADEIAIDLPTRELTAVGNVLIDQGPNRLTGSSARFDLDTKLGLVRDARGALDREVFVDGKEISRVAENRFVIDDGVFTSCEAELPPWSFHVGRADVELEDYAHIRNASMRVKGVPVLYFPYVVWPTKTDRSSGLLVPKIGNSNDRGTYLGLAYYQVLGRSWDTTLFADLYSNSYYGFGNEVRYRPTAGTRGGFRAYTIDDPDEDDWRWKINWDHVSDDLPGGFRGVVHYEDYSDFRFFRDYERQLNAKAKDSIYSKAFVSRNWGNQSLNVLLDRRQRFQSEDDTLDLLRLPEASWSLRPTRLFGSPVYLKAETRAGFLSQDRPDLYEGDYARIHVDPSLSYTPFSLPWLSLNLEAGGRWTWYGDSLTTEGTPEFSGESLSRLVPTAGVELIGPSFSRLFSFGGGPFSKLLHVIEPRFEYGYSDDFDEQDAVPFFDEFDATDRFNQGRIYLTNRILAKPRGNAEEGEGSAYELMSFELSRPYSFDEEVYLEQGAGEQSHFGPLRAVLRSYPTDAFGLTFRANYSMLFSQLTSVWVSTNLKFGAGKRLELSWSPSWQATTGETESNQVSVSGSWVFGRLGIAAGVNYDIERELLRDQRHLLTWRGSCYNLRLEIHESQTVTQRRRDYLFSVDLKNVGTFLDLTGGESEGF